MTIHRPVLANEVVESLALSPGMIVLDGTFGGGGHARLLAKQIAPGGQVVALDRDPQAVARASNGIAGLGIRLFHASYVDAADVLASISIDEVDAILLDLGLSSDQLADTDRGFSFQGEGELDMRFDPTRGEPAWRLLQRLSEKELADVIYRYGEERFSRRIAKRIVDERRAQPIRSAGQLSELVRRCVPRSLGHSIDPATRTFQALRIAVNDELGGLQLAMKRLPSLLKPNGRIVVISFHSLEDRIVKHAFREDPTLEVITKRPIRAGEEEVAENPRARSARLRAARKRQPGETAQNRKKWPR